MGSPGCDASDCLTGRNPPCGAWTLCSGPSRPFGGRKSSANPFRSRQMFTDEFITLFPCLNWSLAAGAKELNENHFLTLNLNFLDSVFSRFLHISCFSGFICFISPERHHWRLSPVFKVTLMMASSHIPSSLCCRSSSSLLLSHMKNISVLSFVSSIYQYSFI